MEMKINDLVIDEIISFQIINEGTGEVIFEANDDEEVKSNGKNNV